MKIIKIIDVIILILASGAFGFGAWGLYTDAGHKEFRELAYIIPDLSMQIGLILFAVHLILLIITYFLAKKKSE
jgi:uncharacterized membrane protein YtjA (UPF0391 family)